MRAWSSGVSLPCSEVSQLLLDGADLDFVEVPGGLLAVAGDEGYGSALVQQFDHGGEATHRNAERLGDVQQNFGRKRFQVSHGQLHGKRNWARKS